jgi:signal transduction histidine kinase
MTARFLADESCDFAVVRALREAAFEVVDNGPGIAAAERDKVLEPFYRVLGAGNSATQFGSGLGLAIARDIADAHGASIELSDAENGGLRVVVRFGKRKG